MSISIVMSVCNAEQYLEDSIKSILNQNFRDFEFLIMDDGSNDNSAEIIKKYSSIDKRIIFFSQENRGLTKSLNYLVRKSNYNLIARMDADDIADENRLLKQYDFLNQNSAYSLVGSNVNLIDSDSVQIKKTNLLTSNYFLKKRLNFSNTFVHSSLMFRKNKFVEAGQYDESIPYAQDYDLLLKMAMLKESKFKILKSCLMDLRIHKNSISQSKKDLQDLCAIYARYRIKKKSIDKFDFDKIQTGIKYEKYFMKIKNRYLFINKDIDELRFELKTKFIWESYFLYILLRIFLSRKV